MKKVFFFIALFPFVTLLPQLRVTYFYPKDSARFNHQNFSFDYNYRSTEYGKTTMLIHVQDAKSGCFEFVFKKKVFKTEHFGGDSADVYGVRDGEFKVVDRSYNEPYLLSVHNLYAFVCFHHQADVVEIARFQEFGNEVYWPRFVYESCSVSDEDGDGTPEFYLTYFADSDGLDAKPLKQIIYTAPTNKNKLTKHKATAYYPAGNEDDKYYEEFDQNWSKLPEAIKRKSRTILKHQKKKFATESVIK